MVGGYVPGDLARRVDEPSKRSQFSPAPARPPFARDRARVLHSSAFRRLADKTQVVDPGGGFGGDRGRDDFPRTRLTHSLEVAQIAREIGSALGCDPDVVDTAGLAHDLGHPPFGHNGEFALNALSAGIGGFEGNAQTLRILTRLEPKIADADGRPAGLNLTRASLDATTKYPWQRGGGPRRAGGRAASEDQPTKFGVYDDDLAAFEWFRAGGPAGARCIEAQIMDWADDVAYSVHDLEDGVHAGQIQLASVDEDGRRQVCTVAAQLYTSRPVPALAPVLDRLLELPALVDLRDFDGSHRALAAAKRATSELTGRFSGAAVAATRRVAGAGPLTRYDADLAVPAQIADECALLKALAVFYVMRRPGAQERRLAQRAVLSELVEALVLAAPSALDVALRAAWSDAGGDAGRLRAVIDQVAQLTDSGALAWHARLVRPA